MKWLRTLFARPSPVPEIVDYPRERTVILPQQTVAALAELLAPARERGHEGVAYLLGRTDGFTAIGAMVLRPRAATGPGSFHVEARDMAKVVGVASSLDLQVVAQVHTHPYGAFHSDGDEDGANIRFDGFVSIVLPDYGAGLPRLDGAAVYVFSAAQKDWDLLPVSSVKIVPAGGALA